ncbi:hypothetical protein M422DRAFT_242778 [Sphaerobolus stellatus SS14]|nr:hypothetical protein M422DRAFT_242778 [Sphaerobolus stellatus SS14]
MPDASFPIPNARALPRRNRMHIFNAQRRLRVHTRCIMYYDSKSTASTSCPASTIRHEVILSEGRINTSDILIFNLDITTHAPALFPSAGSSQTPPPLNPTTVHPVPLIWILVIAITDIV